MNEAKYKFKQHSISDAEKLWLKEALETTTVDPKIAKVKLWGKIPPDFNPNNIDIRLYRDGQIQPIGLWLIDPTNQVFKTIDIIVPYIRELILKKPGIENINAKDIASATSLTEDSVSSAFHMLGRLGHFYSSASGFSGSDKLSLIILSDDKAYDEYLMYKSVEDLLEKYYILLSHSKYPSGITYYSTLDSIRDSDINRDEIAGIKINTMKVKPDTAFIIMPIDTSKPELEDVYSTIKEVCKEFEISAYRADEIEHQDRITDLILNEIETSEFLIADLSYERPNVYYEIGYAHALKKKPILYRRSGTRLHFDLSVHNVPEYKNMTELRKLLIKRFEAILGRKAKNELSDSAS